METPFAMYDALTSLEVPPEKVRVVVKSMERDMALFATSTQFNQLDQYSGSRFDLLRGEIAASRERIDQLSKRFDQVDKRFEQVERRFEQVDKRFDQIDKRFDQIERRFDAVRTEISVLRDSMAERFELVDQRVAQLKHELVVQLGKIIGGTVGGAVAILGGLMVLLNG